MYGSYGAGLEDYPDFAGGFEADEADEADELFEFDEARGRGRSRGKVPTAKRGNPVPQPAGQGYATKAELQATAQRLDGRIATNSKAITTLDGRTRTIEGEVGRLGTTLKREVAERKTVTDALKRGLDESRQIAMLLPLLSTTETKTVDGVPNVVVDSGDKFSKLLPILLLSGGFGGFGSSPGTGQQGGGLLGGDGGIGTLAIVMALSK
jgi:hypothetical protein